MILFTKRVLRNKPFLLDFFVNFSGRYRYSIFKMKPLDIFLKE